VVYHKVVSEDLYFIVIFINDLPDTCSNFAEIFLFADDAKLFKHVRSPEDSAVLQRSCDRLFQWLNQWLLRLNVENARFCL